MTGHTKVNVPVVKKLDVYTDNFHLPAMHELDPKDHTEAQVGDIVGLLAALQWSMQPKFMVVDPTWDLELDPEELAADSKKQVQSNEVELTVLVHQVKMLLRRSVDTIWRNGLCNLSDEHNDGVCFILKEAAAITVAQCGYSVAEKIVRHLCIPCNQKLVQYQHCAMTNSIATYCGLAILPNTLTRLKFAGLFAGTLAAKISEY